MNSINNTAIIEGRVSICTLATLYRFYTQQGVLCSTKSALLKESLETLVNALVENSMCERVTDVQEAMSIMRPLATNHDKKVMGNLSKAIVMQNSIRSTGNTELENEFLRILNEKKEFFDKAVKDVHKSNNSVQLSPEAMKVPDLSIKQEN
jgi:hypothetical protein